VGKFKALAGDTIIYGGGTILVRLLNWLLMPYYIRTMDSVQYGIVTEMYSYIAIFLVILTYGFETTFFRFAKKTSFNIVFSTGLISIISTTLVFLLFIFSLGGSIQSSLGISSQKEIFYLAAIVVSIDAISALIFAKIRYEGKSIRFALLKLINVLILIFFNIFFLLLCPYILKNQDSFGNIIISIVKLVYTKDIEAMYVFISNLIASFVILFLIVPHSLKIKSKFSYTLLIRMYKYSFPILIVGITGMINQNVDKILLPRLIPGDEGYTQLAIYGANFKIGILMAMFTQSFRLAFEPFFFKHHQDTKDTSIYSNILKYFILFGFLIFLGVTFFMDIINIVLTKSYIEGNKVIPIVLLAQLLSGIYFTLSVWYKVSDKTIFGAYMGIIGSIVTITGNLLLIPVLGYYGSALSGLACFVIMVAFSIVWGKKYYYIPYKWKSIGLYSILVVMIYYIGIYIVPLINEICSFSNKFTSDIISLILRIGLIIVFLMIVYKKEYRNIKD
jgi:O-antigen/teichoic acid export membrane protein